MKIRDLIAIALTVFVFAGCGGSSDDVYDYSEVSDDYSETSDNDVTAQERPDEAPGPGGAAGNEPGTSGGSSGNGDTSSDEDISDSGDTADDSDTSSDTGSDTGEIYASFPEVDRCIPGDPSEHEKQKVLDRLNYIRSLHGLGPVFYDSKDDIYTAECSVLIAANKALSHTPDNSWECYSENAYTGCNSSNIFVTWGNHDLSGFDSADIVDAFMTDEDVDTLGHRRWFIDPWLAHISFGRADDYDNFVVGSAIRVINEDEQDISKSGLEFVAYPFENYPKKLYNDNVMMSFSVIRDASYKWNNGKNINLASAAIAIIGPDNKALKVKNILFDTDGYGVPNNLRWFAEGVQPNVKYNVTVTNIIIDNVSREFQYWFELK